jgi:hypothetical protein
MSEFHPYAGTIHTAFIDAAQNSLNSMLLLAFVGAVLAEKSFLIKSKKILLQWAESSAGLSISSQQTNSKLTETGLTLARFFDRIIETYVILSMYFTYHETRTIKRWMRNIGYVIKQSHEFWLSHHRIEGPQNHISWHLFGMASSGIFTDESDLLKYALHDNSNKWNFRQTVENAIYDKSKSNLFREGHNDEGNVNVNMTFYE